MEISFQYKLNMLRKSHINQKKKKKKKKKKKDKILLYYSISKHSLH